MPHNQMGQDRRGPSSIPELVRKGVFVPGGRQGRRLPYQCASRSFPAWHASRGVHELWETHEGAFYQQRHGSGMEVSCVSNHSCIWVHSYHLPYPKTLIPEFWKPSLKWALWCTYFAPFGTFIGPHAKSLDLDVW